jgi:hypothetical protein
LAVFVFPVVNIGNLEKISKSDQTTKIESDIALVLAQYLHKVKACRDEPGNAKNWSFYFKFSATTISLFGSIFKAIFFIWFCQKGYGKYSNIAL